MQLLAADLVAHVRSLRHTHIGHICDALTASGLELDAWTGKSLQEALDADMKTRGWDWPERVERPGAFLLARLRLLPARPAKVQPGGLRAALQRRRHPVVHEPAGQTRQAEEARVARWNADVVAVTTPAQRAVLLRAHEAMFGSVVDAVRAIAGAGRRAARMYPDLTLADALTRWATDVLGDAVNTAVDEQVSAFTSLSTDLLLDLAVGKCDCVVCGSEHATARPQLPLKSTVCDHCWPVIAAELDGASDLEQGMLA